MKFSAIITLGLFVAGCDDAYAGSTYDYGETATAGVTLVAGHAMLTGANGLTLYTFDKDSAGASNCYDDCADSWPPFLAANGATSDAAGLTTIQRRDGTSQWAKDGKPLYFWVGDTAPGDTNGDGIGGVWHVAR